MALLSALFREAVAKDKDPRMKNEVEQDVAYPTGFLGFDYLNGTVIHVKSDNMDFTYNSLGIIDGSMVTVIGRSGCGKTTWIMQSASEIIKPFKTSCLYHDDIEGGIANSRKELLTGWSGKEMVDKYICRNSGVTAENFYERIKIIHDLKMENRSDFEYDTGLFDSKGNRIYKLEPTVYILDSLAMLMPEKYTDEEELSGQMSSTAAAKTNSSIFKRIIPMLKAANIILFVVNHITEKVEINQFAKKQAQVSYLKDGETLGGGRVAVYVTNLLIRLNDSTKLKPTEAFGITGSVVELIILKSRTCAASRSINLVFDFARGFDKELSLYYLIKDAGLVNGAGAYLYFGDYKDAKFSQKQFKEKLQTSPELQEAFMNTALEALNRIINKPIEEVEETEKPKFDITSALLNSQQLAIA